MDDQSNQLVKSLSFNKSWRTPRPYAEGDGRMSNYEYIEFVEIEEKPKTSVWSCRNIKSGIELGIVKWNPAWRQYCYFNTVQGIYSAGCLDDIKDFISWQMEKRNK